MVPKAHQSPLALIAQADENLYRAKKHGKNCIIGEVS